MNKPLNHVLTICFAALMMVGVAPLLLGFASIPVYYERVTTLTIPPSDTSVENSLTNESAMRKAAARHMTLVQYAATEIVYHSAIVLLCMAVAALLILRAGWNWFAWYSAFFLVFIAGFAFFDEVVVARLWPLGAIETSALFWPLIVLYFFLFPNGKPAPRGALWIVAPIGILHFVVQAIGFLSVVVPDAVVDDLFQSILGPAQALIILAFLFILGCQVYRYRRVSTREEKQQTKWFLYGFVYFIVLSAMSQALGSLNPFADEFGLLIFVFVPLSIGIAILRYRLFDIDLLIRRTLIYGVLTALLGLLYFGSVVLLQHLFRATTGAAGELAIILSTLGIAALFNPLRRRVQDAIDHRFYRPKYDAQKVLARFAAAARDEVVLEKLVDELLGVASETMQPASASLWLRHSDREVKP